MDDDVSAVTWKGWMWFGGAVSAGFSVILNMYIMKSAVYVLQMFCFTLPHFDILLNAAMKATEWKHVWKIFVRDENCTESGFNVQIHVYL